MHGIDKNLKYWTDRQTFAPVIIFRNVCLNFKFWRHMEPKLVQVNSNLILWLLWVENQQLKCNMFCCCQKWAIYIYRVLSKWIAKCLDLNSSNVFLLFAWVKEILWYVIAFVIIACCKVNEHGMSVNFSCSDTSYIFKD